MSTLARGMPRALVALLTGVAAAVALSGCGLGIHPPAVTGATAAGSDSTAAVAGHEVRTPPGPLEQITHGWDSAAEAVRRFAQAYINWDATDVAARLRALARASVGQARSELTLEAAETRVDRRLRSGEVTNRGVVETVTPLAGSHGRYLVVTRERTTARGTSAYRGLPAAWHVTVATVGRAPMQGSHRLGWVVSRWQPES